LLCASHQHFIVFTLAARHSIDRPQYLLRKLRVKFAEIADQARKDETKVSKAERAKRMGRAPSRSKKKAPARRSSSGNRTGDVEVAA
jgi:hypothetical protein